MRRLVVLAVLSSLSAAPAVALAQPKPAKEAPRLTKAPRLLRFVEATYPEAERLAGRAASVVLRLTLSATGTVEAAEVTGSAGPAFDAAALEAVKRFLFEPAEIDGKPAAIRILYQYEFALKVEKKTTGDLGGVVREQRSGKPLPGITVAVDTGQSAVTDEKGAFEIADIVPGDHGVTIAGKGIATQRTQEKLEEGKRLSAVYEVAREERKAEAGAEDEIEIVVVAPPLKKHVVSTEVSADQGRRVPGTGGDVLKIVESMPGVARAAVGSGALVVWGAAPQDTRVYVDGVRIPSLYHNGGFRSVVHTDLVKNVELSPGGYGSAYGRGLGGLVTVALRPLDEAGFHGSAAVDVLDASLAMKAALSDDLHFAIAGRRSHLDSLLTQVTTRDVGDFVPIPEYQDAQARLGYRLGEGESIELGGMYSHDSIDRTLSSADPAQTKRESRVVGFTRLYAHYVKTTPSGTFEIVPSVGTETSNLVSAFGSTPTTLSIDSTTFGVRSSWRGRVAEHLTASVGLDVEGVRASLHREGSVTSPAREGDIRVFGQPPSDEINSDDWKTTIVSLAPYVEGDFSFADDALHIVPGVRFEPYLLSASKRTPLTGDTPVAGTTTEDTEIEPRVAVRYAVSPAVLLKAAFGVYHQSPLAEDLSAVFGNPALGTSRATHWLAGVSWKILETLSADVTGFTSSSGDLAIRSPSSTPLLAQALVPAGQGRAYGSQILLRQDLTHGVFGWITYSLLRSERTDVPGGGYRLFDYDQTHVLTALGSYDLGRGFEIGARARYATGAPRTPVLRASYDSRLDLYSPVFGAHNSIRIPAFYQLDVRLSKRFALDQTTLEVYLDVQNVTNHANAEELVYSYDYRTRSTITGLPLLPVAGARWAW